MRVARGEGAAATRSSVQATSSHASARSRRAPITRSRRHQCAQARRVQAPVGPDRLPAHRGGEALQAEMPEDRGCEVDGGDEPPLVGRLRAELPAAGARETSDRRPQELARRPARPTLHDDQQLPRGTRCAQRAQVGEAFGAARQIRDHEGASAPERGHPREQAARGPQREGRDVTGAIGREDRAAVVYPADARVARAAATCAASRPGTSSCGASSARPRAARQASTTPPVPSRLGDRFGTRPS